MIFLLSINYLFFLTNADSSVYILSKYSNNQLITSSTLRWISQTHYSESRDYIIGGYQYNKNITDITKRKLIFVCRASHNGIQVTGNLVYGSKFCVVTHLSQVGQYKKFQLLENIEGAARMIWVHWDDYSLPPPGSVTTDKYFIARHKEDTLNINSNCSHTIGLLNTFETLGTITYVNENGQERSAKNGEILVEMEPLSYNLQNVRLNFIKMKVIKKWSFQVGQITLENENRETLKFSESMNYSYEHHSYWGQGNGMLKGLNTSITLRNKTRLPNINWGIKMQILQNDIYRFDVMLQPYTAMEVSLWTDYIEYEVPFMGQLFSNYADGAVFKPRLINGIQRESKLVGIRHDSRQVNLDVSQSLMNKASIPETAHTRLKDIVNNKSFINNQTYSKMKMQHDFIEGSAIKDNFQENQETLLYHFD